MRPSQMRPKGMSAENEELDELACRIFNPDDHIHVELPSGAVAKVAKDCSLETLAALDRLAVLAFAQFERQPEMG